MKSSLCGPQLKFPPGQRALRALVTQLLTRVIAAGVYISSPTPLSLEKDLLVLLHGRVVPMHTVSSHPPHRATGSTTATASATTDEEGKSEGEGETVVEIDLAKAWDEIKLDPGWSNEVSVQIYVYRPERR